MARNKSCFNVAGLSYVQQASIINFAKDRLVEGLTDRQCRRLEWIYFCLLSEKHQMSREELRQLDAEAQEMVDEFERQVREKGQEAADNALRQRVSLHWGGELDFTCPGNPDKITPLREAEGRIY